MVDSPCNDTCATDLESELCIGCGRTKDEISNWLIYSDEQKKSVLQDLKRRNNIDTRERYMLNNITMDNLINSFKKYTFPISLILIWRWLD